MFFLFGWLLLNLSKLAGSSKVEVQDNAMETVELILKVFPSPLQAASVLEIVRAMEKERRLRLVDLATLEHDRQGKMKITETREVKAGKGALLGAFVGGLLGLFGGPAGALVGAAAGATAAGIAAQKIDFGFSDKFLKEINQALKPGSSAILILVEETWVGPLLETLEPAPGKLFRHALRAKLVEQLRETFDNSKNPPNLSR